MQPPRILSLSELLHLSFPLTGAASLSPEPPPSLPPPSKKPRPSLPSPSPSSFQTFSPITHPVLLIGTVLFPSDVHRHCSTSRNHCLSFSDASSTVCCSILDFDLNMLGCEIHVLAWNFVPFKDVTGGLLEIIRWRLSPLAACTSQQGRSSGPVQLHGVLKSVSPVFMVPLDSKNRNRDPRGSVGFLAEISICKCEASCPCLSVDDLQYSSHVQKAFLYFVKPASLWRPVMAKLIGKVILVSGLKKKMVGVGGVRSYLMFVTTDKTNVSLCEVPLSMMASRVVRPVMNHARVYCGVVTGIYMQGMAVELDEKVWLMITDPLLGLHHSLRVGALVHVMNCHLVCPEFSWTKILLLETGIATNIDVACFSLSDTRCCFRTLSRSLLGTFIESLTLSSRFWVLLLVSCFRRKFSNILSEKEILGSKNKEGLAQFYARSYLPVHSFRPKHGVFMEFCESSSFKKKYNLLSAKLVVPMSNFISKCEALWMSILSKLKDSQNVESKGYYNTFSCGRSSYCGLVRRIISSEELGCILMGTLKFSSSSGRLQLIDATGKLDVVIPDLPSDIDLEKIYEFLKGSDISSGCKTYAEAIVLPYYLVLPEMHEYDQQSGDLSKRLKSECRCLNCRKTLEKIPCSGLCTFANANYQVPLVSGYICNCVGITSEHMTDAKGFQRILLEFKSDCFHRYQFLRLGGYYITKCSREQLECGLQGCHDFKFGKLRVMSQSTLWSLSFSFGDTPNLAEPQLDHGPGISSLEGDKTLSETHKLWFQQAGSLTLENSDVHLTFSSEATKPENKGRSKVKDSFINLVRFLPKYGKILSVSACEKIMMDTPISHSVSFKPERVRLPLGNLVSVSGNIENIHAYSSKSTSHAGSENVLKSFRLNECNYCIHLYEGHHMVHVRGTLSKYAYPVGMAPGVKATFHRVLMTCTSSGWQELLLTPVSFVEIHSIWEVDYEQKRGKLVSECSLNIPDKESFDTASFGLALNMVKCRESKLLSFNCRVVGIHILVLEESIQCSVKSQSVNDLKMPMVNVPLAGVVIDDGSSLKCCWLNAGSADVLLSLGDAFRTFFCTHGKSLVVGSKNFRGTVDYHLKKMFAKHHRVIARSQEVYDISSTEFTLSVDSNRALSYSEEQLLKFILYNACAGSNFTIVGNAMDSDGLKQLRSTLLHLQLPLLAIENIWVKEVEHLNPCKESRNILDELSMVA
ncbi:CST complex subunit CTC1 isoform X2 [Dioscorea cayenensis subsp. rotundata]|uniref:CST complex subunit CTC1 n=1 Tax=Dioscorea cayennensis subsp. rotundata TaxID=55577 RepID=A0AB40ARA1_DIOCR|nr:CST complex subunit CTC1 isoform X2 [Dioscorea cayenensis subsp. rotundata]